MVGLDDPEGLFRPNDSLIAVGQTDPSLPPPIPDPTHTPRCDVMVPQTPLPRKRRLPSSLFPQTLLPPLHANNINLTAFSWGAGPGCSSSAALLPAAMQPGDSRSAHTEPFQQPSAPNTAPVFPAPACRAPPAPAAGAGSGPRGTSAPSLRKRLSQRRSRSPAQRSGPGWGASKRSAAGTDSQPRSL